MIDYFNQLKVKTKLIILTVILVLGLLIYGILSSCILEKLSINGKNYRQLSLNKDLIADILPPSANIMEAYLLAFEEFFEKRPNELQKLIKKNEASRQQYEDKHIFWEENLPESAIKRIFLNESYPPAEEFFNQWENSFLPALNSGNRSQAEQILSGPMKEAYVQHRAKIDEAVRLALQQNKTLEKTIQDQGQRLRFLSIIIWLIIIALSTLLACLICYSIISRLRKELKKVHSASQSINERMNAESHALDQQSDLAKKTTEPMKELSHSFRHSEPLVQEASNRAKNLLQVSEEGNKLIKKMLEGLNEHKDKVLTVGQKILHLSEITKQIHTIAAVTGDLTNQTNILALNAAVQAAQVKQHSEGFTVIASEIRKLADESKKFQSHIDILAQNIQEATDSTVVTAEEGSKTVQECIKLAQSSAEAFDSMTVITKESHEETQQIASNVHRQVSALEKLQNALKAASQSTEQTQHHMQEMHASLAPLDTASEQLKNSL